MDLKQHRDYYLRQAAEYDRRAQAARDQVAQTTYWDMARQWQELADQAARTAGRRGVIPGRPENGLGAKPQRNQR